MSRDNTLKVIDSRMFMPLGTCSAPNFRVGSNWSKCCFSSDGSYIAAGSADGKVYIFQDSNVIDTLSNPATLKNQY
jgi:autophagy-related protein 16